MIAIVRIALFTALAIFASEASPRAQMAAPMTLVVDATDAPRNLLHARISIPATPGPMTLVYPKWIPGEHSPGGRIVDVADLVVRAGSTVLPWRRDLVDMYAFAVDVPAGTDHLDVSLDYILGAGRAYTEGPSSTSNLAVVNWNQVVLYRQGTKPHDERVSASLILPADWQFGTALPAPRRAGTRVDFGTVSLETLIDSPVTAGLHFRRVPLFDEGGATAEMDAVADTPEALQFAPLTLEGHRRLVREALALFGARHWQHYHFLVTLSDNVSTFGLEHHESSDDRLVANAFTRPPNVLRSGALLPHEFVHSWNGKYRRPAGLATADYQTPMNDTLLWVYEGLTNYLGEVLSYRDGTRPLALFPDELADTVATLQATPGRLYRSLEDTALSTPIILHAGVTWQAERRGTDYYSEGTLLWLDADTLIRERSGGRRSLDDFCRLFLGQRTTAPMVVPYDRAAVVAALNAVQPYDWARFIAERIDRPTAQPPTGGLERGGWRLVYNDTPSLWYAIDVAARAGVETPTRRIAGPHVRSSLGLVISDEGQISDVLDGSPAEAAGLGPGMKVLAVNDRRWSSQRLLDAIRAAEHSRAPISFLVDALGVVTTKSVDYHGGLRIAHLVRLPGRPDRLTPIFHSHTAPAGTRPQARRT